jgi:DUF1009 family protein
MLGRRFLILVAVLMGLTALAATLAPRDPVVRGPAAERRETTPTPQPTEAPEAGTGRTIERTISADVDEPQRVVVREGDIVALEIEGSELGAVQLMDEIEPIQPGSNARFNVLADRDGTFPITLVDDGREVGVLEVREAS